MHTLNWKTFRRREVSRSGLAIAFMARRMGITVTICLSNRVPIYRVEGIRRLGTDVIQHGQSQGQSTIGLEIWEDLLEVDTVLVSVGGGGMISGIALALKSSSPNIRVIVVSMERGAAMYESINAGKPVEVEEVSTLADNLGGNRSRQPLYIQ